MACVKSMDEGELRRQIAAIQNDAALSDQEKAKKRQMLLASRWAVAESDDEDTGDVKAPKDKAEAEDKEEVTIFDDSLKCTMCMELCKRPITAPCQHNFCLGCFQKWVNQGKKTCPTCRHPFPAKFAANPRINTALAGAIRMAKTGVKGNAHKPCLRIEDKDRPDEAFTTERAVRAGRANAASGRIRVTVPSDWFGPIPAEHDPERGLGVQVGDAWADRLDCRQWGAHLPHVAGIAGQSNCGAQSVVLSGGYEDDSDQGEWFLYTGSGGRDLSGNKRVTNVQSSDQVFESANKALLLSCQKGLPVRVVRSHKEKRSAYAPEAGEHGVRYDGIYRIVRAYRKAGNQGKLVCRYIFIRADNTAAPWITDENSGDGPWDGKLPQEVMSDIKQAKGKVYEMSAEPWWDYDAEKQAWGWSREPPISQKQGGAGTSSKGARKKVSEHERALKEFRCKLCTGVLQQPLSTPCGHHFCKPCLEKAFAGVGDVEDRAKQAGRALRERRVIKPCPSCKADIADFLSTAQVNLGMVEVIAKLQEAMQAAAAEAAKEEQPEETDAQPASPAAKSPAVKAAAAEPAGSSAREGAAEPQAAPAEAPAKKPQLTEAAKAAAKFEEDLEALTADFPRFDGSLLRGMLEDQAGDVQEVHACLRRMEKQAAAAERKAKKAVAAQGSAGEEGLANGGCESTNEGRPNKRKAPGPARAAEEAKQAKT